MKGAAASERDTFTFQASLAIPESQLFAWFEQAQAGERIVYCQGYFPLREDAAWKLAGAWQGEGLVHLVTEKRGGVTFWIAERRPSGRPVAVPEAGRAKADPLAKIQLAALLDLLRDAAVAGRRCPTKTEMARAVTGQITLRARNRVTYLRRRLEADGKIAVEAGTHKVPPVVTILTGRHAGKSTGRIV